MTRSPREWAAKITAALVALAAIIFAITAMSGQWDRASTKLPPPQTVILYTSVDDPIARDIAERFTEQTGILVDMVGDTEATKTTGLVQRLIAEKDSPRADVWWSSEPLGTVLLARQGILQPTPSPDFSAASATEWPAEWKAADGSWHAFAQRARVLAYNTRWVKLGDAPTTLRELTNPRWKGRIAMARPQFGTTRTHIAALVALHGSDAARQWLQALKANDLRLYDGNSAIARALGMGEIDVGLTDTDDVWSAQRNTWPVALMYEASEGSRGAAALEAPGGASARTDIASLGPLCIPNTVAIIKGAPHPAAARRFVEFLLSEPTEVRLADTDLHTLPIRPWLAEHYKAYAIPTPAPIDWDRVADALPEAMKICEEVLGN